MNSAAGNRLPDVREEEILPLHFSRKDDDDGNTGKGKQSASAISPAASRMISPGANNLIDTMALIDAQSLAVYVPNLIE
jgi:hypothetical protein